MSTQSIQSSRKVSGRLRVSVSRAQKGLCALMLAVGMTALSPLQTSAAVSADNGFFDWGAGQNPVNSAYTKVLNISDPAKLAATNAYISTLPAGTVIAVKIDSGSAVNQSDINSVFAAAAAVPGGGVNLKYVFADYEGPTAVTQAQTQALVTYINSNPTRATAYANGAIRVSNYGYAPIPGTDPTSSGTGSYQSGNSPANGQANSVNFQNSGVNTSAEQLYPGDSSFRNPVTNDSTAPNIRSAMFTLPIQRLSITSTNLGAGQANIPYISRFNNFDNGYLSNAQVTRTDGIAGTQNAFDTSKPIATLILTGGGANGVGGTYVATNTAANSAGQLLSRNDFQALALHYRMRGATGYQLLDPGVQGYTVSDYENDALAGWTNSLVSSVLGGTNGRVAVLPATVTVNGVKDTPEHAGVIYSAVTNDNGGATSGELAILVSNLSPNADTVSFNSKIAGATFGPGLGFTTGSIPAGSHMLLRFTKSGTLWNYDSATSGAAFNNAALASRDGIGIPEPTSLSLLGIGALGVLSRRRRKA